MSEELLDVIILGTGPAGLQAAIHAARRKARTLVLGKCKKSSAFGAHVENFCCIDGRRGEEMIEDGRRVALKAGASFLEEDATELSLEGNLFSVRSESGRRFAARALVLALGVSRRRLGVPGEKEFLGRGVSTCVECDASFFRNEKVAVIGGESAAVAGALTLLFYASEVHLICEELAVARTLAQHLKESAVVLHEDREVTAIVGSSQVEKVLLDDASEIPVMGVFIELGARGAIELLGNLGVALDPETAKFIQVGRKQETNIPGVYAAGDITGEPWQIAKAVGEGCVAGLEAAAFALNPKV